MARKTGTGKSFHVFEHQMDVDGLARDRPLVAEYFHAIDQLYDAVGLLADQAGEAAVVIADGLFEKLRGTADSRKRILDLVCEHGRERAHRTGRPAVGELLDAIARLSPRDRQLLGLRFIADLDTASVGAIVGLNAESARRAIGRALDRLRFLVKGGLT